MILLQVGGLSKIEFTLYASIILEVIWSVMNSCCFEGRTPNVAWTIKLINKRYGGI